MSFSFLGSLGRRKGCFYYSFKTHRVVPPPRRGGRNMTGARRGDAKFPKLKFLKNFQTGKLYLALFFFKPNVSRKLRTVFSRGFRRNFQCTEKFFLLLG